MVLLYTLLSGFAFAVFVFLLAGVCLELVFGWTAKSDVAAMYQITE